MRKASSSSVKPSVTAPENTTHFTFFEIYSMDEMPNWRSVIRMIRTYQNEIQYVTMHDKNMKRHSNCIMFRKTNNRTILSQNVDLSVNFKAVLHLRICAALKSLKLDSIQLPPLKKLRKLWLYQHDATCWAEAPSKTLAPIYSYALYKMRFLFLYSWNCSPHR